MNTQKSSLSRGKGRVVVKKARPQSKLVKSPAKVSREVATLRRGRQRLETAPTTAETDARTTLI
jgi:hypothetical protein